MEEVIRPGAVDDDRLDRSRRVEWLDIDAVIEARVLMAGAGALGNEVAKNLALSGFRDIRIVDMDRIVGSNLNRCMFFNSDDASTRRLKAEVLADRVNTLCGDARATGIVRRVEEIPAEEFDAADIVIGCLDNIAARAYVNAATYAAGKLYVDGGMDGLIGKVMIVRPPNGACLACGMNRSHSRVADVRFSCTGSEVTFHEPRLAAEVTTTSVIGAVIVREAVKHVSGRSDLLLSNLFYYDGSRNRSEELEIEMNPDCAVHRERQATGIRNP
ncbi:MAG: ThiF family adenylyltransferase [Methanobacteriota archaeon]|nr:MAG: ThiF family adenylyltransferase [Euryarchaeota archaeon]